MNTRFFADCPGIFPAPTDVGGSVGRAASTPNDGITSQGSGANTFVLSPFAFPPKDNAKNGAQEGVSRLVQSTMSGMVKAGCSRDEMIVFVAECIGLITEEMISSADHPPSGTSDFTLSTTRSTIPPEGLRVLAKSALRELKKMGCSYTDMLRFANECLSIAITHPRSSPSTAI